MNIGLAVFFLIFIIFNKTIESLFFIFYFFFILTDRYTAVTAHNTEPTLVFTRTTDAKLL